MLLIENYAYCSAIKDIDPKVKLYFSMVFLGLTLFTQAYGTLFYCFLLMTVTTTLLGKIPLQIWLKLLWLPMAFLGVGVLGILLSYSGDADDFVLSIPILSGFLGMTKTGISQATAVFLKAITATACMYFLILNTPMIDLMSALRQLRLPAVFVLLMELMYRLIYIVMDSANGIYVSQTSRLGYGSFKKSYNSLGKLASVLFVRSFLRMDDLFRSLEARGYNGEIKMLDETYTKFTKGYVMTTVFAIGLVLMEKR